MLFYWKDRQNLCNLSTLTFFQLQHQWWRKRLWTCASPAQQWAGYVFELCNMTQAFKYSFYKVCFCVLGDTEGSSKTAFNWALYCPFKIKKFINSLFTILFIPSYTSNSCLYNIRLFLMNWRSKYFQKAERGFIFWNWKLVFT